MYMVCTNRLQIGGGRTPPYWVRLGCICLTSSSGYRVHLGAFILMTYDGLIIWGLVMFCLFNVYVPYNILVLIGTCYTVTHLFTCHYIWCLGTIAIVELEGEAGKEVPPDDRFTE